MNYFRTLAWGPWLYSLLKGAIGAGASSITVMLSTLAVDPVDFRVGSAKSLTVMAWSFGISFAKYAFTFLQASGLPPVQTVTTTETVTHESHPPATVTTTVQETKLSENNPK